MERYNVLVAPTEPTQLKTLGEVSSRPEKYGADFLFMHGGKWYGVQRKELSDLLASMQDGRLAREAAQLQACERGILIVEGRPMYTTEGQLMGKGFGERTVTRAGLQGLFWSWQAKGHWITFTDSMRETAEMVQVFESYIRKGKHHALDRRPGPQSLWGTPDSRDYACHLVMGIDGIGPELAGRIVDRFGVPFAWRVTAEQLIEIDGIGKKKAEKMINALGGIV